ncbi:Diacetyl reductase ((S)-acetoin forming) (fragment) [Burkholderiales bacterium 8X]
MLAFGLDNRVALVSGASRGIGQAIAARLLDAGCRVALTDIDPAQAALAASAIDTSGNRCRPYALDVRDAVQCAAVVADLRQAWGPVSVLVNNAGVPGAATLDDDHLAGDLDRVYAVNVKGIVNLTQACAAGLKATRGSIVNVASITSLIATRANLAYGTSKGAVAQLTRFLARDLGPHGVRVNAVAPGLVMTPMTEKIKDDADAWG